MESIVPITIYAVLALVGLSLLALVLFGLRNLTYGKANPLTAAFMALPVVLVAVLGFTTNDWAYAGIISFLVMLALTSVSLLLSGIRGLLGL
jgi:hypothetical protein